MRLPSVLLAVAGLAAMANAYWLGDITREALWQPGPLFDPFH
jgi:hypothetical protein